MLPDQVAKREGSIWIPFVFNSSNRPISSVACKLQSPTSDREREPMWPAGAAFWVDSSPPHHKKVGTFTWEGKPTIPMIKPGTRGGFIWTLGPERYPEAVRFYVRFTDDAGLHWEISSGLHLEKLAERDW